MEVWKPLDMGLILASRVSPGKNVGVGKFVDWGWSCHLALTAGDGMSANPATGELTSVKMKVGVALGGAGVVEELAGDG